MSSQYAQIVSHFKRIGYTETSTLSQSQLNKALDKIGGPGFEFDREVAQQLWDHTPKERGNTVMIRDYIQSIIEAQNVLKQHIKETQIKLNNQRDQQNKEQLRADLLSYANDHQVLTKPFQLPSIQESPALRQSRSNFASSRQPSYNVAGGVESGGLWGRTSQIFATVPSDRQESWSLKIALLLTFILFIIEILIMFHKNHFFSLIGYTLIILIFVQNFFDKVYMRITIIWIALSVLLDFLWLIVHSQNWWNPYPQTQHSTVQTTYLRFSYFFVIVTMIGKILIDILILRYFNNDESIRKSVTFFSLSFKLDGRSANNPFTANLKGNNAYNQVSNGQYNFE